MLRLHLRGRGWDAALGCSQSLLGKELNLEEGEVRLWGAWRCTPPPGLALICSSSPGPAAAGGSDQAVGPSTPAIRFSCMHPSCIDTPGTNGRCGNRGCSSQHRGSAPALINHGTPVREICSALKPLLWMSVYREGKLSSLGHETAAPPAVRALRSYVCCSHIPMWKGVSWCHRAPRGDPAGRVGTDQPSVVRIWGRVAASWCKCKGGVLSQAHGEGLRPGVLGEGGFSVLVTP